ncbi:MAG: ABC transporter substrate-binding protein [Acidimicrobiia bacterium]|nr:ABC transporter substrate-binding protein [Acidimicrobiia bacterium]
MRKARTRWRIAILILVLALAAAACSEGESVDVGDETTAAPAETTEAPAETTEAPAETTEAPAETTEAPAAANILIAAQGSEPDQLDPHMTSAYASFQVLENVYDTLVQPAADLSMEPALAESWVISDDNLTWTFTLRDGVKFHNGRDLVADDVVYSFERIIAEGLNGWRFGSVESVTAPDDSTVVITLTRPSPNLLVSIAGFKGMAIIPKEIVDDGSIGTSPVGTGPFRFVSQSPDEGIVLEKNPDYWRASEGLPKLDGIRFVQIPDAGTKLTALRTGEVHWIDAVPPQDIESLSGEAGVTVGRVPGGDYHYFALNQNRTPFDDVRVRQAIAHAINREEITEAAQFGAATANQTAIPASNAAWYYSYAPFGSGDTATAQGLLDDAGVSGLTIDFLVTSDFPETVTQAQVIAAELAAVGVTVEITDVDFSTWLDMEANGEFDAFMLSWIGNIDPDDFYYAQHHSEGGFNFQGYSNSEVDSLLDAGRVETDQAARKALYDQAAQIIVDEASYIYLYNPDNINAWRDEVGGYMTRGDNAIRFEETFLQ